MEVTRDRPASGGGWPYCKQACQRAAVAPMDQSLDTAACTGYQKGSSTPAQRGPLGTCQSEGRRDVGGELVPPPQSRPHVVTTVAHWRALLAASLACGRTLHGCDGIVCAPQAGALWLLRREENSQAALALALHCGRQWAGVRGQAGVHCAAAALCGCAGAECRSCVRRVAHPPPDGSVRLS